MLPAMPIIKDTFKLLLTFRVLQRIKRHKHQLLYVQLSFLRQACVSTTYVRFPRHMQ